MWVWLSMTLSSPLRACSGAYILFFEEKACEGAPENLDILHIHLMLQC